MVLKKGAFCLLYTGQYYGGTNHAVTVAGWDDTYSRTRFNSLPAGDGAFLVKNSWGTDWGQSGYFWISYYDANLYSESDAFGGGELPGNYVVSVYEYDPRGWVSHLGYGSTTGWFADVFTARANEQLKAVSTYAASNGSAYVVKIYTGVAELPTSGVLASTTSGTFTVAGYHTVVLPTAVQLTANQKFSVEVSLTTTGNNYPIPVEKRISEHTNLADASPNQSYTSSNGVSWQDTLTWDPSITDGTTRPVAFL